MNCKQVIIVRRDLNMRKGKIAAQVAHASMAFLVDGLSGTKKVTISLTEEEAAWLYDPESAHAKVVVSVDSDMELENIISHATRAGLKAKLIIDAGRTEFAGIPTKTCAAIGPHRAERFLGITDHLKLL